MQPGKVAEHHGVDVAPGEWLVDRQRLLVGRDGPVVVTHRLVDRRDRVQDPGLVDDVIGRAIDLQRPLAVAERGGVVTGLEVDHAEEMMRPGEGDGGPVGSDERDGLRGERERLLGVAGTVGEQCQLVQRLALHGVVATSSGEQARLTHEAARRFRVGRTASGRIVEETTHHHVVGLQLLDRHVSAVAGHVLACLGTRVATVTHSSGPRRSIMTTQRADGHHCSPIQTRS